ncbi:LXG domain-containing protein [Parageobacillus toebii]|uniref:LXG domain-containing protein n=1 Tax=Parageobacillus toebii TaxID=153151 RepID=UPI00281496D9|nr:LXG domain-containing protein [Parageobacillus toebii]WMT18593.1 LXG domain-containing protein [Parageobacillus toebii]
MRVLDVSDLENGVKELKAILKVQKEQINNIKDDMQSFTHSESFYAGEGAKAIRFFYNECHVPFLRFLENFIDNYQRFLVNLGKSLNDLEPANNGFIRESFLEYEITSALRRMKNTVIDLIDEANGYMNEVNDIVCLTRLDDQRFMHGLKKAEDYVAETVEDLRKFDSEQMKELSGLEADLQIMKNYTALIESMFCQGDFSILSFNMDKLNSHPDYRTLTVKLRNDEMKERVYPFTDFFATINEKLSTGDNIIIGTRLVAFLASMQVAKGLQIKYIRQAPTLWQKIKGDYRFAVKAHPSWTSETKHESPLAKFIIKLTRKEPNSWYEKVLKKIFSGYRSPSDFIKHMAGYPKNIEGILIGKEFRNVLIDRVSAGVKETTEAAAKTKGMHKTARHIPVAGIAITGLANLTEYVSPENQNKSPAERVGRALTGVLLDAFAINVGTRVGILIGSLGGPPGMIIGGAAGAFVGGTVSSLFGDKIKDIGGKVFDEAADAIKKVDDKVMDAIEKAEIPASIKKWFS